MGRRVAFVEFEEKRDALEAMEVMDCKKIGGSAVSIRLADDRPPPGAGPKQPRPGDAAPDQKGREIP